MWPLTFHWISRIVIRMVNHVEVFAALGDANRTRMVTLLSRGDVSVSQLARHVDISLPATLKHLGVLETAGLVSRTKTGRTVTVHLETEPLSATEAWLHRTGSFWTSQLTALADSFVIPDTPPED